MRTDVVIVGGGPAGAAQAMFLAEHGVRSTIIEMQRFPRYHIGESMTGECGGIVRRLGLEGYMRSSGWPCKQGVKVYGEGGRNGWFVPVMQRTDAGELQEQTTWQVRRSDFDTKLLAEAESRGATIVAGKAGELVRDEDGSIRAVRVEMADGGTETVECEVFIDASGQQTFLARSGVTSRKIPGRYDKQIAVFSQFRNTIRDNGSVRSDHGDNTLILYARRYHWAWFIPLDDEVVSVGVVQPAAYFMSRKESLRDFLQREIRELNPELSRRVPDLTPVEDVRALPNYSYYVEDYTGTNWLCLGDAHRFIDPIFSFGLYLTMMEAEQATPHIVRFLNGETQNSLKPFADHQRFCDTGTDRLQELIDGFWGEPMSFAFLVNGERTRADMIDLFAGRIYGDFPKATLQELTWLAEKARLSGALDV